MSRANVISFLFMKFKKLKNGMKSANSGYRN